MATEPTVRLTVAQATVKFLAAQYVERDGRRNRFFAGCFGIFGHGNVAGIGQALEEHRAALRYYLARNEQAMVHTAAAYAKMHNRLRTFACTSSIGPGATKCRSKRCSRHPSRRTGHAKRETDQRQGSKPTPSADLPSRSTTSSIRNRSR